MLLYRSCHEILCAKDVGETGRRLANMLSRVLCLSGLTGQFPQAPPASAVAVPLQEALLGRKSQVILELQNAGDRIEEVIAGHRHEIDNDLLEMVQRRLEASIRWEAPQHA